MSTCGSRILSLPDPAGLPGLPRDEEGPVFAAPWHAQAFAMAVALNERGLFGWNEWAEILGAELRHIGGDGDNAYYTAWLSALERLLAERGIVEETERRDREDAWDRAARATPHGRPIVLSR